MIEIEAAAKDFITSASQGVHYPPAWFDRLTIDQAFNVQQAILRYKLQKGDIQAGWKVGLTAEAIQEQFNVHEPVCGYLLTSGSLVSGEKLSAADLIDPGVENEICFKLGLDLKGPGVTAAMARNAVDVLYPAMELVEYRGDLTTQLAVAVADNVMQAGYVLGDAVQLTEALNIAEVDVRVYKNRQLIGEGNATAVLGNPFNSLAWLANKLAEFDMSIKAGELVMAGSLTQQYPLRQGDIILAEFSRLGTVEFGLV